MMRPEATAGPSLHRTTRYTCCTFVGIVPTGTVYGGKYEQMNPTGAESELGFIKAGT